MYLVSATAQYESINLARQVIVDTTVLNESPTNTPIPTATATNMEVSTATPTSMPLPTATVTPIDTLSGMYVAIQIDPSSFGTCAARIVLVSPLDSALVGIDATFGSDARYFELSDPEHLIESFEIAQGEMISAFATYHPSGLQVPAYPDQAVCQ